MSLADRAQCERTMRVWYAKTGYTRPDPAGRHEGEAQRECLPRQGPEVPAHRGRVPAHKGRAGRR